MLQPSTGSNTNHINSTHTVAEWTWSDSTSFGSRDSDLAVTNCAAKFACRMHANARESPFLAYQTEIQIKLLKACATARQ